MIPPKLTLTDPTLAQINAAVAEHVAGWRREPAERSQRKEKSHYLVAPATREWGMGWDGEYVVAWKDGKIGGTLPPFSTSADAVLPLLEKHGMDVHHFVRPPVEWVININSTNGAECWCGRDTSFARAACLALLAANNIEVIYTDKRP